MMKPPKHIQYREKILTGSIIRTMFWLAWPIFLSNLVNISYNLVDALWLGRLGREAFGAPTVSWPMIMLIYSIGFGYLTAGISLTSQYYGAGDFENAEKSASQQFFFSLIVAVFFSIGGFLVAPHILAYMGVPSDIYPLATSYTRTIFIGIPFVFTGFVYITIANSLGDTRTPTVLNIISSVANIILDPLFIFGYFGFPKMGVNGAAVATILSRTIVSVVGVYYLFKGILGIRIRVRYMWFRGWWLRKIIKIGTPLAIQQSSNSLGFAIMMSIVSKFGSVVVAAYGVAIRIIDVLQAFTGAVQRSVAIMIGQNIGAEKYNRAKKIAVTALVSVFVFLLVGSIIIYLFRDVLIAVFINDPAVIVEGAKVLGIFTWSIPFFGVFFIAGAIAMGSGHTKIFAIISITRLWLLRIGLSILLAVLLDMGSIGIYIAMAISNIVAGVSSFIWIMSESWVKKVI